MHRVAIDNQEPDPTLTFHGKIFSILLSKLKQNLPLIILIIAILYTSIFVKQCFLKNIDQ